MSVYFEETKPKRRQWSDPRKADPTGSIVVHTAENMADLVLPDSGADSVAKFIKNRSTAGSYHELVDSDSYVQLGRYEWQMYHEGTGGNRWSYGISFCCKAKDWPFLPDWWIDGAFNIAAKRCRLYSNWMETNYDITIPATKITPDEYRNGKPGFLSHGDLDPNRRYDPGSAFDWDEFLNVYQLTAFDEHVDLVELTAQAERLQSRMWALEAKTFITWAYQFHHESTPSREVIAADLEHAKIHGLSATRWRIANGV